MNPTEYLVIDTETTGLRYWHGDRPFAISLCDQDGETEYYQWPVNPVTREVTPDPEELRLLRKRFRLWKGIPKVLFNAKFDYLMLKGIGIELQGPIHDMGVAARICNTNELNYKLKPLASRYCDIDDSDEKDLQKETVSARNAGKKRGWKLGEKVQEDYWMCRQVNPESQTCERYAVLDVLRTQALWMLYMQVVMPKEPALMETYNFEMESVWPVINALEARGAGISKERNHAKLEEAVKKQASLLAEMRAMLKRDRIKLDKEFDCTNAQIAEVLYVRYKLEIHKRTKPSKSAPAGNPSTDWKALREHLTHPFVVLVVRWRSAQKSVTTYFGKYEREMIDEGGGVYAIHGSFNQLGANKTSRLSSNAPNLQNAADANNNPNSPAPIQAREPFGPRPGYRWYCLDYSGQEVRIFAETANITEMLDSIRAGRDVMNDTANRAWGGRNNIRGVIAASYALELGNVTPPPDILGVWQNLGWNAHKARVYGYNHPNAWRIAEKWLKSFGFDIVKAEASIGQKKTRTRAKNLTYAKIYGAGASGVMDMLYCSRAEARQQLRLFDDLFPGMPLYIDQLSAESAESGYVETLYGRRLNVESNYAYRAVNYRVQGTGADMIKRGMVRTHSYLRKTGKDAHLLLPIHDELVFEVKIEHAYKWLLRGLRNIMEDVAREVMTLPMPVECNRVTRYWSEKTKVELGYANR